MAQANLPDGANLENLKKQAKALLKAAKAKDQSALGRVGPYFGYPEAIGLQQAQLVLAREYGFRSWTSMKRFVEDGRAPDPLEALSDRFLDLACVSYSNPPGIGPRRFEQAAQMLADHPDLAGYSLATASVAGNLDAVDRILTADPDALHREDGPFNWPPIMYASYGRLPGRSSFPAAQKLLDAGARGDAFHMWSGVCRFTALTGVLGRGEAGEINQPEHPDELGFAEALLDHGADPNDAQACYNRGFTGGNGWLKLLIDRGFDPEHRNDWLVERDGEMVPEGNKTMGYLLAFAIRSGDRERVELLINAGAKLNEWEKGYGPTAMAPLKLARLSGRPDIADVLESAGAESPDLTSAEKLRSALMSADGAGAQAILDGHPDLRADAPVTRWMHMAAGAGRHAAVKTMIDLEFPVEVPGQDAPLHAAAYAGDMDMARLLIAAGADTTLRDPTHNGPPLGFAMFANQSEMVQFLLTQPMDIFAAAWVGKTDVLASLVADQPNLLNARFTTVRQNTEACPDDWKTPLAVAVTDGQTETAAWLLQAGADPTVTDPDGRSIRDIGLASDSPDIRALFGEQR